jgi:hypothetical protein
VKYHHTAEAIQLGRVLLQPQLPNGQSPVPTFGKRGEAEDAERGQQMIGQIRADVELNRDG